MISCSEIRKEINMRQYEDGRAFAQKKDQEDPLKDFQQRFYKQEGVIYMDGNSLDCAARMRKSADECAGSVEKAGIDMWEKYDYFLYQDKLGAMCAPLCKCRSGRGDHLHEHNDECASGDCYFL